MDPMQNLNNAANALNQVAQRGGAFWDDADAQIAQRQAAYDGLAGDLVGIILTENINNGIAFGGTGAVGAKAQAKSFNTGGSIDWVDIVTVGVRGGFKITVSGDDASDNAYGMHISEHWAVSSNNLLVVVAPTVIHNTANRGFDTQWVGPLFQIRPQDPAANQLTVKVEVVSRYVNSDAQFIWS